MSLKKFLKCQKENCEHLFPQKNLENERKIYIKTRDKKCGKETNVKQQTNSKKTNVKRLTKCFIKTLTKSKYKKMLDDKKNCGLQKCKNEHDIFLKDLLNGKYVDKIDQIFHLGACSKTTEPDREFR